jgi:hypothetical protein
MKKESKIIVANRDFLKRVTKGKEYELLEEKKGNFIIIDNEGDRVGYNHNWFVDPASISEVVEELLVEAEYHVQEDIIDLPEEAPEIFVKYVDPITDYVARTHIDYEFSSPEEDKTVLHIHVGEEITSETSKQLTPMRKLMAEISDVKELHLPPLFRQILLATIEENYLKEEDQLIEKTYDVGFTNSLMSDQRGRLTGKEYFENTFKKTTI